MLNSTEDHIDLKQLNLTLMVYADFLKNDTYMFPIQGTVKSVTTGIYKVKNDDTDKEVTVYRNALKEVAEQYNFRVSLQKYDWGYKSRGLQVRFIPKDKK